MPAARRCPGGMRFALRSVRLVPLLLSVALPGACHEGYYTYSAGLGTYGPACARPYPAPAPAWYGPCHGYQYHSHVRYYRPYCY
jgi:hypothetical protein